MMKKMQTDINKIEQHNFKKNGFYWLFAMLGSSIVMYLLLSYEGVLSTGKYALLNGDALEIYAPTIRNFCRNLVNGESIYYSWNNFLGMNTSLNMAFYGAFNPFNVLYFIFYKSDSNIVSAVIIILKTGLIGLSFQLFERYVLKVDGIRSVLFAVLYSLCAFQVSYNLINFIWIDALYLLPFSFIAVYILSQKRNPVPLCIIYLFAFITHLYMGYVIGVISFLFFFCGIWLLEKKVKTKYYILHYFEAVLISILISAVIWLPAAYFLLYHRVEDSGQFYLMSHNILEIYNQLFWGSNSFLTNSLPNLYCGIIVILLLPFYFTDKRILSKEKICYGIILLFLILSCVVPFLYKFMHAFEAPDGWAYRFSFCLSFILVSLAAKTTNRIGDISKLHLVFWGISNSIFFAVFNVLFQRRFKEDSFSWIVIIIINIIMIAIWVTFLILLKLFQDKEFLIRTIWLVGIVLVGFECVGNGYAAFYMNSEDKNILSLQKDIYNSWQSNQTALLDYLDEIPDYYRVNYVGDLSSNSDTFYGYNGISDFCTTENPGTRVALGKMGLMTSPKVIRNYGLTDITKMIFGVKTDVYASGTSSILAGDSSLEISNYPYALSLGFMVHSATKNCELTSGDAFDNNNELVSAMLNQRVEVFDEISKDNIIIKENGVHLLQEEQHYQLLVDEGRTQDGVLIFQPNDISIDNLYFYFQNDNPGILLDSMLLLGGDESISENAGLLSTSYIKPACRIILSTGMEDGVVIYANGCERQEIRDYQVAYFSEESFKEVFSELSQNQLNISDFYNGYIRGTVTATEQKSLLFTSIPFDEGWNAWVNGKKVETISLLDNAFIGIELNEPGEYDIEMRFIPGFLKEGVIVSILGVVLFLGLVIMTIYKLRDTK